MGGRIKVDMINGAGLFHLASGAKIRIGLFFFRARVRFYPKCLIQIWFQNPELNFVWIMQSSHYFSLYLLRTAKIKKEYQNTIMILRWNVLRKNGIVFFLGLGSGYAFIGSEVSFIVLLLGIFFNGRIRIRVFLSWGSYPVRDPSEAGSAPLVRRMRPKVKASRDAAHSPYREIEKHLLGTI